MGDALFLPLAADTFQATELTRGPWHPDHQHGGPPTALLGAALERLAESLGVPFIARLTVNFLRPVPIGVLHVVVEATRAGRKAAHLRGIVSAGGKEVMHATALALQQTDVALPEFGPHGDEPRLLPLPADATPFQFPFFTGELGYHKAVEGRLAAGTFGNGPAAIWFRLRQPVVQGHTPSPLQRVLVAADSGNGISIVLDIMRYTFVNPDLSVHLHRTPVGEWVALDARTIIGPAGAGLATTRLFDERGQVGHGLQSLIVAAR